MTRIIFFEFIVLLLPFAAYGAWRAWTDGRKAMAEGAEAATEELRRDTPILTLTIIGVSLAIITFLIMAAMGGGDSGVEGQRYQPARLVDGEIVPGGFVDNGAEGQAETPAEEEAAEDPPARP